MLTTNLSKLIIEKGGKIVPLVIPKDKLNGTGLMNPSVYNDNGKLFVNLRNVNYTLYHCEGEQRFYSIFGSLGYLNPFNRVDLKTTNFIARLNENLEIMNYSEVDTSELDVPPVWEFVGLEDVRMVRWDDKLIYTGVRRDTKTDGEGRIELSEVVHHSNGNYREKSRVRIEPPKPSYCEKNWMPILDMPYHFVKWTNPTEVVKVNPETKSAEVVYFGKWQIQGIPDLRGGSQVINWKHYRICLVHEVDLYKNKIGSKDADYRHRFVVWDKDWNILRITEPFSFAESKIEFCCGMAEFNGDLIVSFAIQDSSAFLLKIPEAFIETLLGLKNDGFNWGDNDLIAIHMITKEVFEDRLYERHYEVSENDVVVDIGANVGAFSYSIMDRKPRQVVCVEPSDSLINQLVSNTSGYDNVFVVNAAIAKTDGSVLLTGNNHVYAHKDVSMETVSLRKLIDTCNITTWIDMLKIDCEGGEYDLFCKENKDLVLSSVKNVAGEFHLGIIKDGYDKFIEFRDKYLTEAIEFKAYSGYHIDVDEDITDKIFDDTFISEYITTYGERAQIMLYIKFN